MFARELNHERVGVRSFHRWFYCCITLLFHIDADLTAVRRDSKPDYLHASGGKTTVDQTGEFSQFDLSTTLCLYDSPVNINDVAIIHIPLLH